MKKTCTHEVLHFIYFEKWKQVFRECDDKKFDYPHLIWKLSEIVPKCILKDGRIQKVFKHEPEVYKIWEETKIDDKPLLNYIQDFYDNKKDFAEFLKQSYEFIKQHEKELS